MMIVTEYQAAGAEIWAIINRSNILIIYVTYL